MSRAATPQGSDDTLATSGESSPEEVVTRREVKLVELASRSRPEFSLGMKSVSKSFLRRFQEVKAGKKKAVSDQAVFSPIERRVPLISQSTIAPINRNVSSFQTPIGQDPRRRIYQPPSYRKPEWTSIRPQDFSHVVPGSREYLMISGAPGTSFIRRPRTEESRFMHRQERTPSTPPTSPCFSMSQPPFGFVPGYISQDQCPIGYGMFPGSTIPTDNLPNVARLELPCQAPSDPHQHCCTDSCVPEPYPRQQPFSFCQDSTQPGNLEPRFQNRQQSPLPPQQTNLERSREQKQNIPSARNPLAGTPHQERVQNVESPQQEKLCHAIAIVALQRETCEAMKRAAAMHQQSLRKERECQQRKENYDAIVKSDHSIQERRAPKRDILKKDFFHSHRAENRTPIKPDAPRGPRQNRQEETTNQRRPRTRQKPEPVQPQPKPTPKLDEGQGKGLQIESPAHLQKRRFDPQQQACLPPQQSYLPLPLPTSGPQECRVVMMFPIMNQASCDPTQEDCEHILHNNILPRVCSRDFRNF